MPRMSAGITILVAAVLGMTLLGGCVGTRKKTVHVTRTNPAWRPPPKDASQGR